MEAKLLSECGERFVVDAADKYEVAIEPGEYIVVEAGACVGKPGARFTHPNIALTAKRLYGFKHYRASGSKFWTERAGVSHYFVIPRSAVKLLPEKGYSYIPAEINGVKVSFNVSGGGGSDGWTDYLYAKTTIAVNHPVKALKALAAVAVRGTALEPLNVKTMEADEEARWNVVAARATPALKEKVVALIEAGKNPVVHLLPGYSESKGEGVAVYRRYVKEPIDDKSWRLVEKGAVKSVVLSVNGWKCRAKLTQIDWYATAKANGIAA